MRRNGDVYFAELDPFHAHCSALLPARKKQHGCGPLFSVMFRRVADLVHAQLSLYSGTNGVKNMSEKTNRA